MNLLQALPLRLASLFVKYVRPPKYELSVCAQFRDEGPYLDEWLTFHVRAGVEHFFLYNDSSTDNFEEVLRPWMEAGLVTLDHSRGRTQEEIYTHCLGKARLKTRWLAFIDLDEFLFTPPGLPLSECLKHFEDSAAVFVFWKIFGSNGRSRQRSTGVIESFVTALDLPFSPDEARIQLDSWLAIRGDRLLTGCPIQGKSIVRPQRIKSMGIHFPRRYLGKVVDEKHNPITRESEVPGIYTSSRTPSVDLLRINHYWARGSEQLAEKLARPGTAEIYRTTRSPRPSLDQVMRWEGNLNSHRDYLLLKRERPANAPFVFLIGFNKTATRAFDHFFRTNGFPAVHWDGNRLVERMLNNLHRKERILTGYDRDFRFFSDFILMTETQHVEGNRFFKEIDRDYPGSFFILNNRSTESWLLSRERHNGGEFLRKTMAQMKTTSVEKVRRTWRLEKQIHESQVREYFRDRTDFLEVDISDPDVPEKVSQFLDREFDDSTWTVIGKTEEP